MELVKKFKNEEAEVIVKVFYDEREESYSLKLFNEEAWLEDYEESFKALPSFIDIYNFLEENSKYEIGNEQDYYEYQ